jgi:hypothetical protein
MRKWIARRDDIEIGTVGYLVATTAAGQTTWTLHAAPVKGWFGVGKVVRLNKTRSRAEVLQLHRAARDAFLQEAARRAAA